MSKMGRPASGSLSSFEAVVVQKVLELKMAHPGWGSKTIYSELSRDRWLSQYSIPKPSTIALFLKQKGLNREYEAVHPLPNSKKVRSTFPHQVWQIDGQGACKVSGLGRINLINIKDIYSRIYCGSLPVRARSHNGSPSGEEYQLALRLAFMEFGLPDKLQADHAGVFYENKGKSPFPTRFHLWLISLGLDLIFSRKFRPTDQAIVERSHQTMSAQALQGHHYDTLLDLHRFCDKRRRALNFHLPCQSTNNTPPIVAYPKARLSAKYYQWNAEKEMIQLERIYQYLKQGIWIRKVNKSKTCHLGGQWYYLKSATIHSKVTITFCSDIQKLIFKDTNGQLIDRQNIKGITHQYLMGNTFSGLDLPSFQLKIPFGNKEKIVSTTFLDST